MNKWFVHKHTRRHTGDLLSSTAPCGGRLLAELSTSPSHNTAANKLSDSRRAVNYSLRYAPSLELQMTFHRAGFGELGADDVHHGEPGSDPWHSGRTHTWVKPGPPSLPWHTLFYTQNMPRPECTAPSPPHRYTTSKSAGTTESRSCLLLIIYFNQSCSGVTCNTAYIFSTQRLKLIQTASDIFTQTLWWISLSMLQEKNLFCSHHQAPFVILADVS